MIEYILIAILIGGASYTSYKIGLKAGAANAIEILHEERIVAFDQAGNIKPNPFYKDR